jgi:hypothetical protein
LIRIPASDFLRVDRIEVRAACHYVAAGDAARVAAEAQLGHCYPPHVWEKLGNSGE